MTTAAVIQSGPLGPTPRRWTCPPWMVQAALHAGADRLREGPVGLEDVPLLVAGEAFPGQGLAVLVRWGWTGRLMVLDRASRVCLARSEPGRPTVPADGAPSVQAGGPRLSSFDQAELLATVAALVQPLVKSPRRLVFPALWALSVGRPRFLTTELHWPGIQVVRLNGEDTWVAVGLPGQHREPCPLLNA